MVTMTSSFLSVSGVSGVVTGGGGRYLRGGLLLYEGTLSDMWLWWWEWYFKDGMVCLKRLANR